MMISKSNGASGETHMSLFDVIRYPVYDIHNDDELDILPEEIWLKWIHSCGAGVKNLEHIVDTSIRRSYAVTSVQQSISLIYLHNGKSNGSMSLIKAQMTKRLKEIITEHDD